MPYNGSVFIPDTIQQVRCRELKENRQCLIVDRFSFLTLNRLLGCIVSGMNTEPSKGAVCSFLISKCFNRIKISCLTCLLTSYS